jgi:hypothetical protein
MDLFYYRAVISLFSRESSIDFICHLKCNIAGAGALGVVIAINEVVVDQDLFKKIIFALMDVFFFFSI